MEECEAEGVKTEVAFCQAMKETGFLRFPKDVKINQYNFAGIGATGGVPGNSFSSVRMGIRAQVQHLKAYASTKPLNNPVVDPRFDKVVRGSAPYVQWLGQKENPNGYGWATDQNYGYSIVDNYIAKLAKASSYSSWYEGKNYSSIYSPQKYMQANPDVAAVFGGSSEALIRHFINNGMKEGRRANDEFEVQSYRRRYKDLRTVYGNDLEKYYYHYMNYGKYEHRIATGEVTNFEAITTYQGVDYSPIYDYNYYVSTYPDIENAFGDDDTAVLQHFVNHGIYEGRQGIASFNVKSYKNQYPDLRVAYGTSSWSKYYLHYLYNGYREGRTAIGSENNIIGGSTVYNGINYSAVYDADYYVHKYADLYAAFGYDDSLLLQHFVNHGMSEGRQGNASFEVHTYKNRYLDLNSAYGDSLTNYYLHYINYGKKEGRSAI